MIVLNKNRFRKKKDICIWSKYKESRQTKFKLMTLEYKIKSAVMVCLYKVSVKISRGCDEKMRSKL